MQTEMQATAGRKLRKYRLHRVGGGALVWFSSIVLSVLILMGLFPGLFLAYDPYELNGANVLQPPSWQHPFGTDEYGRDLYSRIVEAARATILIGAGSAALAALIGVPLGLLAGYLRGKTDRIIMLAVDAMMSFPSMLLAILIVSAWKPNPATLICVISLVNFPRFTMIVRSNILSLREREYVMAAKLAGLSDVRIMFHQILPNAMTPIIVQASLLMGNAILIETGLSYLGLGLQPPDPSWGGLLSGAQNYMLMAPWYSIIPGVAILMAVLSVNVIGDYLRDKMDVRR
ncbi:ABC transporter permease [Paenibacillaceae bacterium WGS1546]|uniref:ABC transporter permease n=1 Tax=Cohnella sp. WGS1546 TaxID=3366810 RepID=UPI00372D7CAF